jgi:acyl carrier protein
MKEADFCARLTDRLQSLSTARIAVIRPDDLLFSTALIDSMTIVDVIDFVESYWRIKVDPSDLSMENFDSVTAIMAYVRRKLGDTA